DLGWDENSRMVAPVDAVSARVIEVVDLKVPPAKDAQTSSAVSNNDVNKKNDKVQIKKAEQPKPAAATNKSTEAAKQPNAGPAKPATNGTQKDAKAEKPSKQVPEAPTPSQTSAVNPPLVTPDSYSMAAQRTKSPARDTTVENATAAVKDAVETQKGANATPTAVSLDGDVQAVLSKHFDSLYQRLESDKRVFEASGAAKQDAMLRLVSSTLTDNVEQSLSRIITSSIDKAVIPALTSMTGSIIEKKLAELVPQQLGPTVQREVKAALPNALQQSLRDQQVHRTISEQIAQKVQQQVSNMLQTSLPNMATQATQKMVADLDARTTQRLREADVQRQQDNAKIEQLSGMVRSLTQTVQGMAESQKTFHDEMKKMQQGRAQEGPTSAAAAGGRAAAAPAVDEMDPQKVAEEQEVSRITQMLMDGSYEEATINWLQSANQATLFDRLFVRVNPAYLRQVSPLVALSVSAAITASFQTNVDARLEWLAEVLSQMNISDPDIRDVAPKIMDVISSRLQGAYMEMSESNPSDPRLRRLSALNRQVNEVRRVTA
ncbi:hypothetical protein KC316_g19141, partial [Hortaea werneckii]